MTPTVATTTQRCFVIQPSFPRAAEVLEQCIKPACAASGYQVETSTTNLSRNILKGIVTPLQTSPMVVAYLGSGQPCWNPNVMIEVGYRLASALPLVLVCDSGPDGKLQLPFDIDKQRMVVLPANLTDTVKVRAAIRAIEDRIAAEEATIQPLRSVHPIATIQVETEQIIYRNKWKYVAVSEKATELFGINGKLVGRSLGEFVKLQTQRMPPVQAYVFAAEQQSMVGSVSDAFSDDECGAAVEDKPATPVVVAKIPIVFGEHPDTRYVGRAYMPTIIITPFQKASSR